MIPARAMSTVFTIAWLLPGLGCEAWPPAATELIDAFPDHRPHIDALIDRATQDELSSISRFEVGPMAVFQRDPPLSEEQKAAYAASFDALPWWVSVVRLEDDSAVAELASTMHTDERDMFARYVRGPNDAPLCTPELEEHPCGWCSMPIADDWHVFYYWNPSELIPLPEFGTAYDEAAYEQVFVDALETCRRSFDAAE